MGFIELVLIGVGLAMDAFAVSVCKGLAMKKVNKTHCIVIAVFFGGFQFLMPILGWLLGKQFQSYIQSIDHWVAFALLVFLGAKAIVEAVREKDEADNGQEECFLDVKELFLMAIATSIDALAVGITFAFLKVDILTASGIIGIVTFILCIFGVFVGNIFGSKFKKKAAIVGGVILILIGVKILVEHLGLL